MKDNDTPDWARSNDMVFHAVVQALGASWARDIDPITAIKAAHSYHGSSKKCVVAVVYGHRKSLNSDEWGSFQWDLNYPDPIPVGLYEVSQRSIKPYKGEDTDNAQWIQRFIGNVEKSRERFEKEEAKSG